jgi:hypothetical protein
MRCIERPVHSLSIFIAVLFCLLTFAQTTRPIAVAASSGTQAAPVHRKVTRNCIEEVGTDGVDVIPEPLAVSTVETSDSEPPPIVQPEQLGLPAWPLQPIHRKLLPPSPQDG